MPARIGLMGLGRIGRNVFRILQGAEDLELAAVCDPADKAANAYLLRFDTILGRFPGEIRVEGDDLVVGQRRTRMIETGEPGAAPWGDLGVETVIEATAGFRTRNELERHFAAGARRVILCAPPADPPDITVVIGVNEQALLPAHRIVSNGSATANAAAPVLRLLDQAFGIQRAFLTTVHAYSNQQRLADVPAEDPRRGRAAAENIIPQETNAGGVITELLPRLRGRLSALAMNVPVANGSVADLVCWHERTVTTEEVNRVIREAVGTTRLAAVLGFEDAPIVSSDIRLSTTSGTFDSLATMVLGERVSKTLVWFDNGWGYAHRVIDLIRRFRRLDAVTP